MVAEVVMSSGVALGVFTKAELDPTLTAVGIVTQEAEEVVLRTSRTRHVIYIQTIEYEKYTVLPMTSSIRGPLAQLQQHIL